MFERINDTFTKTWKDATIQNPQNQINQVRKAFSNSQSQSKTSCILCFKDPKPYDESIKAKFSESESDGAEVSPLVENR